MSTTTPTREDGTADGAAPDAPATGRASVPRPSRRRTDPLYHLFLLPALALVGVGQVLVHLSPTPGPGGWSTVVGTVLALVAVASWSWYGLDSHRLIAARPDLGPVLAGAQGLAAGVLALPIGAWLIATEGVTVDFTDAGLAAVARIAAEVNGEIENIGARRLQTVMEKLLEEVSFDAEDRGGTTLTVDAAYVEAQLAEVARNTDLSRFVL